VIDETTEQLISKLKTTQKQLSTLLAAVAEDQDWQPEPDQWSFRFIAAHLATVERECFQDRVVRIAAGENPHFESYFNTGLDFSPFDLSDSLREWAVVRHEIIAFVQSLPQEGWSLVGSHAVFGTITVFSVLHVMLNHDREHLEHLERLLDGYRRETLHLSEY
jgi:hypothetical protein